MVKANICCVIKFLILLFLLLVSSCASIARKQDKRLEGEFMIVDEDKDLDLLRIEEISTEQGPSGGCPT